MQATIPIGTYLTNSKSTPGLDWNTQAILCIRSGMVTRVPETLTLSDLFYLRKQIAFIHCKSAT